MSLVAGVIALFAALGHMAICVYLNNRLHGTGLPRQLVQAGSLALHTLASIGALLWFWWLLCQAQTVQPSAVSAAVAAPSWLFIWYAWPAAIWCYVLPCVLVAAGPLPWSLWQRRMVRPPAELLANHGTQSLHLGERLGIDLAGPGWRRFLVRLPGNEMLRLEVNEKTLRIKRLAPALDGLSIVHLSDLHFTGTIKRRYFEELVERANVLKPDIVAITGDLLDKTACIDWVPYTLGRLRARYGAFFVLGNHDLRVDWRRLRETLKDSGLLDLGGRWHPLNVQGREILLAGNELPWFRPAADLAGSPSADGPERPLRIALSHSPDQLRWARRGDFDLLLAGHNHGGQIRLPFIGPVFTPSLCGVKYASGVFYEPPTLLHVSRGVSGRTPLRYNCPPELTKLVLTCGKNT
jgi:predicted MPP superfamily phosphohydrolase